MSRKPPRHPRNANPDAYRASRTGGTQPPHRGCWPRKTLLFTSLIFLLVAVA